MLRKILTKQREVLIKFGRNISGFLLQFVRKLAQSLAKFILQTVTNLGLFL